MKYKLNINIDIDIDYVEFNIISYNGRIHRLHKTRYHL